MAEEWGTVIFGVSDKFQGEFDEPDKVDDPATLLAKAGKISLDKIENLILTTKKVRLRNGYVAIEYDCADWRAFSELFVAHGEGLEFYSRTLDEYGASGFFALSFDGERFSFSYDQDGDMFDVEGYEEEVEGRIAEWMSLVPGELKEQFPGFIDEGEDDPFPDWPKDSQLRADNSQEGRELLGSWQWRGRETVLHFSADDRVITFELYREPEIMTLEWLTEDRINIEGNEASFQISRDELTMTFGDGRAEKLNRVDSPRILKSLVSDD